MKLLIDACVWAGDRDAFSRAGHDPVWVADWNVDPGDEAILAMAHEENRNLAPAPATGMP